MSKVYDVYDRYGFKVGELRERDNSLLMGLLILVIPVAVAIFLVWALIGPILRAMFRDSGEDVRTPFGYLVVIVGLWLLVSRAPIATLIIPLGLAIAAEPWIEAILERFFGPRP